MAYFTYYGMQNLRPVVAVFGEVGPESHWGGGCGLGKRQPRRRSERSEARQARPGTPIKRNRTRPEGARLAVARSRTRPALPAAIGQITWGRWLA